MMTVINISFFARQYVNNIWMVRESGEVIFMKANLIFGVERLGITYIITFCHNKTRMYICMYVCISKR